MTGHAVVGRALLFMATDAEAHGVVYDALGDRHLREIAVAGRAINLRADMRSVVETDVRFLVESVDALPCHVFVAFGVIAQSLDPRIRRISEVFMARHTDIDARNSGPRALFDALMAIRASHSDVDGVDFMRKIDRLLRLGADADEMFGGVAEAGMRRCECGRSPSLLHVWIVRPGRNLCDIRLLHTPESDAPQKEQCG